VWSVCLSLCVCVCCGMASTGGPNTAAEWYALLYEKQAPMTGELVGRILARLTAAESGDTLMLRENLLLALQDAAAALAEEPQMTERVFEALHQIARNPAEPSRIRSQTLITQTALSIELEALQMRVPYLESLLETLLDLCAGPNGKQDAAAAAAAPEPEDRGLRSAACRCLSELEEASPGLLACSLPSLIEWMSAEKSHVLQDLVSLAALVLLHGVTQLVSTPASAQASAANLFGERAFTTTDPPTANPQQQTSAAMMDTLQKEVLRAVGTLLSAIGDLPEWGVLRLVALLKPLISTGLVPATVLAPHCARFVHTSSPLTLFAAADLACDFPELWSAADGVVENLIDVVDTPTLQQHWRILAVLWLAALVDPKNRSHAARRSVTLLKATACALAPTALNSFDLKEARLCALARCFDNETLVSPADLLDLLVCMDDFRAYRPSDKPPRQFFNVIRQWLDAFPTLLEPLFSVLTKEITRQPDYLPHVLVIIDTVSRPLAAKLLEKFSQMLTVMPSVHLPRFLPIANKIVSSSVSPTPVLIAITNLLRKTTVCSSGQWGVGNDVLSVCREALLHHPLTVIFGPLGELLSYMADNFADLGLFMRQLFPLLLHPYILPVLRFC